MPMKENRAGEMVEEKSIKLNPVKITVKDDAGTTTINNFEITDFDKTKYKSLEARFKEEVKPNIAALDYKEAATQSSDQQSNLLV